MTCIAEWIHLNLTEFWFYKPITVLSEDSSTKSHLCFAKSIGSSDIVCYQRSTISISLTKGAKRDRMLKIMEKREIRLNVNLWTTNKKCWNSDPFGTHKSISLKIQQILQYFRNKNYLWSVDSISNVNSDPM